MSASEARLLVDGPDTLRPDDRQWFEGWLTVALGIRVRLATAPTADAVRVVDEMSDTIRLVCDRLRRGQRADGPPATGATLDRVVGEIGRRLVEARPDLVPVPMVPPPYRCALVLTHDVDAVDRWTAGHDRHLARHLPERLGFEGARAVLRLPWAAVRGLWDDPRIEARIRACVAIERRLGVHSTYLFFSPAAAFRSAHDGWYTARTRFGRGTVEGFWRELQRDGFDVGLHLSIGAHADTRAIEVEWDAMRAFAPGLVSCRSHYLKEAPGVTYDGLAAAGALVDLNLLATGYPYGTGAPFRPTDGNLYRLPTVIDDSELPVDGSDPEVRRHVCETWEPVLTEARRNGSVATVLLHTGKRDSAVMLEQLLRWGADHDAWMASAAEFIGYWREREARLHGRPGPGEVDAVAPATGSRAAG